MYVLVGVIYRHPDQSTIKECLDIFSNCLHELSSSKQTYYLIGDFNIWHEKEKLFKYGKNLHKYINC